MRNAMIAVLCVLGLFTGVAQATVKSNTQYEYYASPTNEMTYVKLTPAICTELGYISAGARTLINLGLSDQQIQESLVNVAVENMSSQNVWTAFHMAIAEEAVASLRNWPNSAGYQDLRRKYAGLQETQYTQMYAEKLCMTLVGQQQKILKVERRVKQAAPKKQGRTA